MYRGTIDDSDGKKRHRHLQVARVHMMRAMTMLPAFSLVIPAFNEAERIGETLRDVIDYLRKISPESEIIVVNDGSTDATSE